MYLFKRFDPMDQPKIDRYAGLSPKDWRWKWRMREAARSQWHTEYGGYYPAMGRSAGRLEAMKITPEEQEVVDRIVTWMEEQTRKYERWW